MKKLLYIFLTSFLISSCTEKAQPTTIQGHVTTRGTTTPLPGLEVNLIEDNGSGIIGDGNGGFNGTVKTTYTDQNGYYRIDYDCYSGSTKYWLTMETAQGHLGPITQKQVWPGNNNVYNYKQLPFAYVRLHIKNVNPFNVYDKFNFLLDPGGGGGYDGSGIDVYTIRRTAGNVNVLLYYSAIKNNQLVIDKSDTLIISAYDTLNHEILY